MNFTPYPLLYGVSEDFFSSFKLVVTMRSEVQHRTLSNAVSLLGGESYTLCDTVIPD